MKEEMRFRYVEYFCRSPSNKKIRKNWIHERATKRAGFNRFPTVTIFEKISNLVFVRRTLYISIERYFFLLESEAQQYAKLAFPILYSFDWLWSWIDGRIGANCGMWSEKMENWLGGLWQRFFVVKKWSPLSNKNFGGCPADLVSAWGLFFPASSSKCFSMEAFCEKISQCIDIWLLMKSKILHSLCPFVNSLVKKKIDAGNIIHFGVIQICNGFCLNV